MFYSIKGNLIYSDTSFAVVECDGVGFKCYTSLNTIKSLPQVNKEVLLYTHLSVKDDALDLYGFKTQDELECFKLLIGVSGIGPKAAVSILSEFTPERLALCIASGDYKSLTKAQGIGKKIAERAILELKSKMTSVSFADDDVQSVAVSSKDGSDSAEAVEALVALGYNKADAALAVSSMDKSLSVDEMIRQGLKLLASSL